jgi:hypothetical protein
VENTKKKAGIGFLKPFPFFVKMILACPQQATKVFKRLI